MIIETEVRKLSQKIYDNQPGILWSQALKQAKEHIKNAKEMKEVNSFYSNKYKTKQKGDN